MEDWAEIRRLHKAEGMPIKVIARTMGCSKNTVKRALSASGPPSYSRAPSGSVVDVVEPLIREYLQGWPSMPATVIAERIGWEHSIRVLRERVSELRPAYLPPDPASRTAYEPGELAQFDFWFPDIRVPVGAGQHRAATALPVLTMVSGYSRWRGAVLVPTRSEQDLYSGWWHVLSGLGAVPRVLVWDGEGAVGRWRARQPELTQACQAFRGVLGAKVVICKPADPEAKGMVERFHDHLERSFLPGRTFTSPADFNTQLSAWTTLTNSRHMRVLGCRPCDRVETDRAAMMVLPPVAPVTGWHASTRLPRDHYVRLDSNDYSVHPGAVGRRVEVAAGLERVVVTCDGKVVADHPRSWAKHQSFTDPTHATEAAALRRAHVAALSTAGSTAVSPRHTDVQVRDLASYDTALGIDVDRDAGIDVDRDAGIDVAAGPDREDLGPAGSGVA